MKLVFLIYGNQDKNRVLNINMPHGFTRKTGRYGDNNLFVSTISCDNATRANAKILADIRDTILNDNVKCLYDEASELFCKSLYPLLTKYERGLRTVLTVAMCADSDNFHNSNITSLEQKSLEALKTILFYDQSFSKDAKGLIKKESLRKNELLTSLTELEENTLWEKLFCENDMPTVASRFNDIKTIRNDVMHFHTVSYESFQSGTKLLRKANIEIDNKIESSLNNINYANAKTAAKKASHQLAEAYADIHNDIFASFMLPGYSSMGQQASSVISSENLANQMSVYSAIAETIQNSAAAIYSEKYTSDAAHIADLISKSVLGELAQKTIAQKIAENGNSIAQSHYPQSDELDEYNQMEPSVFGSSRQSDDSDDTDNPMPSASIKQG